MSATAVWLQRAASWRACSGVGLSALPPSCAWQDQAMKSHDSPAIQRRSMVSLSFCAALQAAWRGKRGSVQGCAVKRYRNDLNPCFPTSTRCRPAQKLQAGSSPHRLIDRKSTRLNSSHLVISYAVFCLKKKIHQIPSAHDGGGRGAVPARGGGGQAPLQAHPRRGPALRVLGICACPLPVSYAHDRHMA